MAIFQKKKSRLREAKSLVMGQRMLQGSGGRWGEKLDRLTWPSLPHLASSDEEVCPKGQKVPAPVPPVHVSVSCVVKAWRAGRGPWPWAIDVSGRLTLSRTLAI